MSSTVNNKDMRLCEYCRRDIAWLWSGKRQRDGTKIYLDHQGRRWSGKRCAECEKVRVQTAARFSRFDRISITNRLRQEGYRVVKFSNPIVVRKKDGSIKRIALRKALINGSKIALEEPLDTCADSCMLVFSYSRIFTKEQLSSMPLIH